MVHWHIETDFVAIAIFLVLVIKSQLLNKQKNFTDKTFILANVLGIASTAVDIFSSTVMNNLTGWWFYEIGMIFYGLFAPLLTMLWVLYTITLVYRDDERKAKRVIYLFLIPYILYCLLVITNPIHELMFSLTKDMVYARGQLFIPLGIGSQMFYAATGTVLIFCNWKRLAPKSTAMILLFLYIATTSCYWIQNACPGWLIICSAYAVAFLFCDAIFESQRRETLYVEIQHSLERAEQSNAALKEQMAITNAIGNVYFSIYSIDLKTGNYIEITARDDIRNIVGSEGSFSHQADLVSRKITAPEHASAILEFLDLSTLNERMRGRKIVTGEFLGTIDGWTRISLIEQERDEEGNLTKVICTTRQIADEKEKEITYQKKLEAALAEANQASQAKSDFLSRMSHDIRTPINGIHGMLEIIRKNRDDQARVDDCLEKIKTSSGYLLSLVNDVLDMSKLESGEITLAHDPSDLCQVLTDCDTVIRPLAVESGIHLITDMYQHITHPYLIGSPVHMRQIFINIASNAVKYNRPGGSINCSLKEMDFTGTTVTYRFTISDTGIGMKKEFVEHVFEPFSQENANSRSKYGGTGLGMSIVKRILDNMGGTITVTSQEGKGSTFTCTIPFELDPNPPILQDSADEQDVAIRLEGVKVLVVEDNELNQEIAQFMLEEVGAIVDLAENGQVAVDKFQASPVGTYQIILMDIMMPLMDGLAATRAIRAIGRADAKTIPIIAMTANAFMEDIRKCREAGMDAHLAKPLESETMLQMLAKFVK